MAEYMEASESLEVAQNGWFLNAINMDDLAVPLVQETYIWMNMGRLIRMFHGS